MSKTSLFYFFSLLILVASFQSCTKAEDTKRVPKSFTITSVTVNTYPPLDANGDDWDISTGSNRYPDLYLTMYNNISVPPVEPRLTETNDNVFTTTSFSLSGPYAIDNLENTWVLRLYDDDDISPDEFMGELTFAITDHLIYNGSDTPSPIITLNRGQIKVTLVGYWLY